MKTWIEAHRNMCIQQLLQKSVNKLRSSYELVAGITVNFQSHIMRCYMMFASSPVEGANAPLYAFLSYTVFSVKRKWDKFSGILLRTFSGHYECLLLLHRGGR